MHASHVESMLQQGLNSPLLQMSRNIGDNLQMQSPVTIDPEVMSGAPVFRGTRVPVRILFDHLETGETVEEFLEGYPSVTKDQVITFLELVSARVPEFAN